MRTIYLNILLFSFFTHCVRSPDSDKLVINLPPMPETVLYEISAARQEVTKGGLSVPETFERNDWNIQSTGKRILALLTEGREQGRLASEKLDLLDQMSRYLVAFQLDEEEDFLLAGAALALTGAIYSSPSKLDYRYRIGMSRMMYAFGDSKDQSQLSTDLVRYLALSAKKNGLPILKCLQEYCCTDSGGRLGLDYFFTMSGNERDFLSSFKLPGEAGKVFVQALNLNELATCRRIVADYYSNKLGRLEHLKNFSRVDMHEAEDLLENVFILRAHMVRKHDFGPRVDWTTVLDNDIESNVSINHHPHLLLLAQAWQQTGDLRFRDHLIELMKSWLEQSPRPDLGQWALQWRTLEVGGRASTRWPQILALGVDDSDFVRELFYPMIYCLYQHADYLSVHNMRHPNNWSQVEAAGMLATSMILSEHRQAGLFRQIAMRRFKFLNQYLYFPDGVQTENSFYYHALPLGTQIEVFRLARSLGTEVGDDWRDVLERGIEALVWSALPDGSIPMVSDVGPRKSYIGIWQKTGRELFPDNPAFRFLVGVPEADFVELPPRTNYRYPWAGYGVMRQDWTVNSQYMLFDMGFYGTNHQHEDKLNIIIYAYGRELLHDPGIYRYSNDGFERYFRGSRGHNLILVDGKSQCCNVFFDKNDPYCGLTFPDQESRWIDKPGHILAEAVYRPGYADKLHQLWYGGPWDKELATYIEVTHKRKILWIKGDYWVMLDLLTGVGEHKLEQVFHFSPIIRTHEKEGVLPGNVELLDNKRAISRNSDVANLAVLQVGGSDLKARKEKGKTDPHVGWTCLYGENPAWDVTFETRRELPAAFCTVLLPLKKGQTVIPLVKSIKQDTEGAVFDLVFPDRVDRIIIATDMELQTSGNRIEFMGEALVLRKTTDTEYAPVVQENAKRIVINGQERSIQNK